MEYFGKKTLHRYGENSDVTITVGKKQKSYITFRNCESYKGLVPKDRDVYIVLGLDREKEVLFFISSTISNGYKLSRKKDSAYCHRYLTIVDATFYDWAKDHIGDYSIRYDDQSNQYYIQTGSVKYFSKKSRGGY